MKVSWMRYYARTHQGGERGHEGRFFEGKCPGCHFLNGGEGNRELIIRQSWEEEGK
jgi:hypothetical protein